MATTTPRKPANRKPAPKTTPAPKKTVSEAEKPVLSYTVIDDVLRYTTKAGHDLVIDLDFPSDLLKLSMGSDEEDRSEDDQFEIMARSFGTNFEEAYAAMGVIERRRVQAAVFLEFQKAMSMPLGESSGSSPS